MAPALLVLIAEPVDAQRSSDPWWGASSRAAPTDGWAIRIPVTVENNRTYSVANHPVAVELDFTKILLDAGWTKQSVGAEERLRGFTLDVDSIRVVPYGRGFSPGPRDGAATEAVPHVFYPSMLTAARTRDFDASRNPAGTVMFTVDFLAPSERAYFYVYANPLEFGKKEAPKFDLRKSAPLDAFLWGSTGTVVYGFEPTQSNQNHRVHVAATTTSVPTTVTVYTYNVGRFQPLPATTTFPNPVTLSNPPSAQFIIPTNTAFKIVADNPIVVAAHGDGALSNQQNFIVSSDAVGYVPSKTGSFVGTSFSVFGFRGTAGSPGSVTVIKSAPGTVEVTAAGQPTIKLTNAMPTATLRAPPGWSQISASDDILVTHDAANSAAPFTARQVPALTGGPLGTTFYTPVAPDGGYARICVDSEATMRVRSLTDRDNQLSPQGPMESTAPLRVEPKPECHTERANALYPSGLIEYFSMNYAPDPAPGSPVPFTLSVGAQGRTNADLERGHVGPFGGLRGIEYQTSGAFGLFGHYPDTKVTITEFRTRGASLTYTINLPGDSFFAVAPRLGDESAKRYHVVATKPITAVSTESVNTKDFPMGHHYGHYLAGRPHEAVVQVGLAEFRGPLVEVRSAESDARQVFRSTGPGTPATFGVEVLNLGRWIGGENLPDDIELTCADIPEDWKVDGCTRRLRLDSRAAERVDIVVTPSENDVDKTRTITVTARSLSSDVTATLRLIVHVEIRYGIGMWFDAEGGRKSIDPPVGLDPGESHRYNIVVKNTGSTTDRFEFDVEAPRDGWTQALTLRGESVRAVTLEGGETVTLHFTVTAPGTETAQQNIVRIKGQSVASALAADLVNTASRIRPKLDVRLDLDPPTRVARPNETAVFNLTLTNSGNDIFRITLREDGILPEGWTSSLAVKEVDLGPGQPYTVQLLMTPPATIRAGESATAKIAAEIDAGDGGGRIAGDEVSAVVVVRKVHNLTTPALLDATTESGIGLDYLLQVANLGNGDEVIEILPGASTPSWRVTTSAGNLFVDMGRSADMPLRIDVPRDAAPGEYNLTFTVRLSRETFQNLTIPIRVAETQRIEYVGIGELGLLPGQRRVIDASVVNAGNVEADFVFSADAPEGWLVAFEPPGARLAPGESKRVVVSVTASRAANDGAYAVTFEAEGALGATTVAASLARPDLFIERIDTTGRPRTGDLVLVSAVIGNRGAVAAENVTIALVVDGVTVDEVTLQLVPVGEPRIATLSWLATGSPRAVSVRIDPANALVETTTDENEALVNFGSRLAIPLAGPFTFLTALGAAAFILRRRHA